MHLSQKKNQNKTKKTSTCELNVARGAMAYGHSRSQESTLGTGALQWLNRNAAGSSVLGRTKEL